MPSAKKIAANRSNGLKGRGPRTKEGKAAASRNALRHGLSTISYRNPQFAREIEERAIALCEGDTNPRLLPYAIRVAEWDVVLRCVRRERVAVIERCRDGKVVAQAKGDNSLALAKIHSHRTKLAFAELEGMGVTFDNCNALIPEHLLTEEGSEERRRYPPLYAPVKERDEVDAFCEAVPDLERLDRYERRALSARKRAMRDFVGMLSWEKPVEG
jgi:hypothetical protein